ncbi:hypothetical protein KIPB_013776, partial [Kipferlia bialata]
TAPSNGYFNGLLGALGCHDMACTEVQDLSSLSALDTERDKEGETEREAVMLLHSFSEPREAPLPIARHPARRTLPHIVYYACPDIRMSSCAALLQALIGRPLMV